MAELQDEEQWLYGDDKEEHGIRAKDTRTNLSVNEKQQPIVRDKPIANEEIPLPVTTETNGEVNEPNEKNKEVGHEDARETQQNGEKAKNDADDDSSSDDEPTVTIGKIVKQPDIMRPPPPTHRGAPTSGLKDEDFSCVGKINGVPAPDYNLAELEEKPWRKPGADLSDYFNYGFTEDTWLKYCERQKSMRITESGIGLTGLGINVGKSMLGSSNIPVSIVNENSKYGGLRKPAGVPIVKTKMMDDDSGGLTNQMPNVNTIQVMTADRRTYSSKVLSGQNTYDEMDFGGNPYSNDFFNTPPPANFFTPPPWGGVPNLPPPGWTPDGIGAPPPMPHHRGVAYFDEDSVGALGNSSRSSKDEREMEKIRESLESRESRDRESRHHSSRRRSRSRSKSRHRRRSRSRSSRSRSPSHRHKRKKSKRDRDTE